MSVYVYREKKVCVTEKQLFSGANCFLRAFALKFLVMINENVLGCNLLLAVSNSFSPSAAFFFISAPSQSRRSIASLLDLYYINVLCWVAFPNPCLRYYVSLFFTDASLVYFQAGKRQLYFWLLVQPLQNSISGILCRVFGFDPSPFWTWRRRLPCQLSLTIRRDQQPLLPCTGSAKILYVAVLVQARCRGDWRCRRNTVSVGPCSRIWGGWSWVLGRWPTWLSMSKDWSRGKALTTVSCSARVNPGFRECRLSLLSGGCSVRWLSQ